MRGRPANINNRIRIKDFCSMNHMAHVISACAGSRHGREPLMCRSLANRKDDCFTSLVSKASCFRKRIIAVTHIAHVRSF
jgi:hypothetical protein